jgi:hypothetical protein
MDVPGLDLESGIRAAKNIGGVLLLRSLSRASGLVLLFLFTVLCCAFQCSTQLTVPRQRSSL